MAQVAGRPAGKAPFALALFGRTSIGIRVEELSEPSAQPELCRRWRLRTLIDRWKINPLNTGSGTVAISSDGMQEHEKMRLR